MATGDDSMPKKSVTPETVTEADLAAMGMTREQFDAKFQEFTLHKALAPMFPNLGLPLYKIRFPLKTACVPHPAEWFVTHKERIMADADARLAERQKTRPFDATYAAFTPDVREAIFLQMSAVYHTLGKTGRLEIVVSNGCCTRASVCIYPWYQRCLLQAMRKLK